MTPADEPAGDACPLAAIDRRLEDAHQLWHQASEYYFDPDAFRIAIQATIQTLRSVTFILQKHKATIPNFKKWYGAWQERLKADELMRWLVDARNKIEKEGDLESKSFVRAEIIASYLDEGPGLEVPAELFQNVDILLRTIPEEVLREHVIKHGALRIQRRWVENSLPNHELLDALAICYGRIRELVHDAHRHMGLHEPQIVHGNQIEPFDLAALNWKMPCMVGHHDPRSLIISLSDGASLTLSEEEIDIDEATKRAIDLEDFTQSRRASLGIL